MTGVRRLSEVVYVGLCNKIGTREEVSMRRDIADIIDVIENKFDKYKDLMVMLSGSRREGFRLSGSDRDYMLWLGDHKVICDLSQAQQYQQPGTTLFLMECVEFRPGFVFLQLLTPSHNRKVNLACIKVNDVFYISSTIYRKLKLREFLNFSCYKEHGPCANIVMSHSEFDGAFCFSCDYWPPLAASWIQRCSFWPSPAVVYEIVVSGCHFMAIGSKESPSELFEWRLSFSQAEQKLVYAMNHCQFLVYGLLKLFLKEVINQGDQGSMLCSYFMKTAVFWEIQVNSILSWCPQNILICFWACFKRIMKWVYHGYCPNFFVAENNMFWNKICGSAQNTLFLHLHKLYQNGLPCLLYCESIRSCLYETLHNPTNVIHLRENNRSSVISYSTVLEMIRDDTASVSTDMCLSIRYLKAIENLSKTNLTKCQSLHLHSKATECLIVTAFCIHQVQSGGNRSLYNADLLSCKLLKIAARSGRVSYMLYLAMNYYNTCRYKDALAVLHMTEVQFNQHNLTYNGNGSVEKCIVDMGGYNLLDFWKKCMFYQITLFNDLCYINQLILEQRISKGNGKPFLLVSPLVLLHALYVLCYNHVNTDRRQEALNNLYMLVHHHTGNYIPDKLRDISYQILGICEEICGDFSSAIRSYNLSRRCEPFHGITEASLLRIKHASTKFENIF